MKRILMALVAVFSAVTLMADTETVDGYTWTFTIDGGGAKIYNSGSAAISPLPTGGVAIPATLDGKPVTAIGDGAFSSCGGLTDINIPATVTSIGTKAFMDCSGLTSIEIPASVTAIEKYAFKNCYALEDIYIPASVTSIHEWTFDNCSGLTWITVGAGNANYKSVNGMLLTKDGATLVQGINGGVTIPDGVTTIGNSAFCGCSGLWSVTIPASVTTIATYAFYDCDGLTSVTIPDGVTTINLYAFNYCNSLKRVTLPKAGVDNFKSRFTGCPDLTVVIADGVTSIPDNAFKDCTGIKSVLIPGSVTTIGESAFEGCTGLECLSICSGVTTIKANAFKGCKDKLDCVTIPSSVASIGNDAFGSCDSLNYAVVPAAFNTSSEKTRIFGTTSATIYGLNLFVEAVGGIAWTYTESGGEAMVFGGSSYVRAIPKNTAGDIIVPSTLGGYPVTKIDHHAFADCDGITGVTIPYGVTEIKYSAFNDCDGLTSIVIPSSVTAIGNYSFYSCDKLHTAIVPTTCYLGTGVFDYCHPSFNKILSDDVNVFVTLVDGILWTYTVDGAGNATLGDGYGAPAVPTTTAGALTIPASIDGHPVTAIGRGAFYQHSDLTSVTIPSGVTAIGDYAFNDCFGLQEIVIPQSVMTCGDYVFAGCFHLVAAVAPESLKSKEYSIFYDSPARSTGGISYRNVDVAVVDGRAWVYTVDGIGNAMVGGGVDELAISRSTAVGDITIPSTLGGYPVTTIGDEAFLGCDGLTDVTIPEGVMSIGSYVFEDCIGLATVNIPSTVEDIDPYAFDNCSGLTAFSVAAGNAVYSSVSGLLLSKDGKTLVKGVKGDVTIPVGVEIIGDSAFYGSGLTSVLIPSGVTKIDKYAFGDCDMLASVAIPFGVTKIDRYAFGDCDMLADISIPASVTTIGTDAFDATSSLTTVYVEPGSTDSVKSLLEFSGKSTAGITFVENLPPSCTITFDATGGVVSPATRRVLIGATVGELPTATRDGYTLKGWFTAVEGGEPVTLATVVTADVTFFAQWTKLPDPVPSNFWFTTRDEALAEAKKTGKTVFMICGRDTCGNTMYTKNVACEDPKVKGKLTAKCVLWYTNIDTQDDDNYRYWKGMGEFPLPVICAIDPNDPEHYIFRIAGPQTADGILNLLQWIPEPSGSPVVDPESLDPYNPGTLPCYEVLNPADIWNPIKAPKAVTLMGAAYYGCDVVGILELKVGKPSRDMYAKVSGSVMLLDGKKYSIKSQKCYFGSDLATTLNLDIKGGGRLKIAIGSIGGVNVFSGELGNWHVQTANVGGNWNKSTAAVKVDMSEVLDSLPSGILTDLIPTNEVASVSGGKWKFAKAAGVKYAKPKAGQTPLTPIDAAGKGLVVDTSKGKTNLSGLKITYTMKKGTFKGSFKMFELKGGKLVKYTVNINGVVVDGVGYGKATCKKPAFSCPVVVE